jgi:hypothetical protein
MWLAWIHHRSASDLAVPSPLSTITRTGGKIRSHASMLANLYNNSSMSPRRMPRRTSNLLPKMIQSPDIHVGNLTAF